MHNSCLKIDVYASIYIYIYIYIYLDWLKLSKVGTVHPETSSGLAAIGNHVVHGHHSAD